MGSSRKLDEKKKKTNDSANRFEALNSLVEKEVQSEHLSFVWAKSEAQPTVIEEIDDFVIVCPKDYSANSDIPSADLQGFTLVSCKKRQKLSAHVLIPSDNDPALNRQKNNSNQYIAERLNAAQSSKQSILPINARQKDKKTYASVAASPKPIANDEYQKDARVYNSIVSGITGPQP